MQYQCYTSNSFGGQNKITIFQLAESSLDLIKNFESFTERKQGQYRNSGIANRLRWKTQQISKFLKRTKIQYKFINSIYN